MRELVAFVQKDLLIEVHKLYCRTALVLAGSPAFRACGQDEERQRVVNKVQIKPGARGTQAVRQKRLSGGTECFK